MNEQKKAEILDKMILHAKTLLDGKVIGMENYDAESIILAKYQAKAFLEKVEQLEWKANKGDTKDES